MNIAIKELIKTLKTAREQQGLSQRALSEKIDMPQSHISKIESGQVDVQLSSLVELARNLELEVMLIPRQIIPAVKNIINWKDKSQSEGATPAYKLDDEDDDNA